MRRLAAAVVAALLGVVMPGLATTAHADVAGAGMVDRLIELTPGEDPAFRAKWIAEKIGANAVGLQCLPDDYRAGDPWTPTPPLMHCFTHTPGFNGFWLQVTDRENDKIEDLLGTSPPWLRATGEAYEVSLPMLDRTVTFDAAPSVNGGPWDRFVNTPQVIDPSMHRLGWDQEAASELSTIGVSVAVADTGVDYFHTDLNVRKGFDCTFEYGDRWAYDPHGHGTFVSGVSGAYDNERGTVGYAPGVPIVPIPVLGSQGYGTSASVACGVDMGIALGASVINFSLGGFAQQSVAGGVDPYHNVFAAGCRVVLCVVAAGNDGVDLQAKSPANYPEVITVGAINATGFPQFGIADNEYAWFSNFGLGVDAVAPGVQNRSIIPGNGRAQASGTSFSAPSATGVIAAYLADHQVPGKRPDLTAAWKKILRHSQVWMSCDYDAPPECVPEGWYAGWPWSDVDMPPLIRWGA